MYVELFPLCSYVITTCLELVRVFCNVTRECVGHELSSSGIASTAVNLTICIIFIDTQGNIFIMNIVLNELPRYDSDWVTRKRSLCTQTVFKIVSTAHVMHSSLKSIPAPTSDVAICKAIAKMSPDLFRIALRAVNEKTGTKMRRVFALDGSWIRLPPSFASTRHKQKGSNCLGLLSVLIDVNTKQPVEWRWGGKNERNHALSIIRFLRRGDVIIMDRGYFSKQLLQQAALHGLKVLFRVTKPIFNACKRLRKHNTN